MKNIILILAIVFTVSIQFVAAQNDPNEVSLPTCVDPNQGPGPTFSDIVDIFLVPSSQIPEIFSDAPVNYCVRIDDPVGGN